MIYNYVVTTPDGKVKRGEIEAPDKAAAILMLKKQQLLLVKIEKKKKKKNIEIAIGGIKFVDKVLLARHLSVMIKAGVNLGEALDVLTDQATNPKLKKILKAITGKVLSGHTFSSALEEYPKVFSELFVNMVRVGETSGTLSESLEYLAMELEKSYELKKKVKSAAIYPAIVLIATFGLGFVLVYFILPKMIRLFETLTVELPLSTRILIAIAKAIENHGLLVLGSTVAVIGFLWWLTRQDYIKPYTHRMILMMPVIGHIAKQISLANFNRTLSILMTSGVPVVEALKITSGVLNNHVYRAEIKKIANDVEKGLSLAESLTVRPAKMFPKMSTRLIGVGEKTGQLDNSLQYLGEFYAREVDNITKNLSNILEPALLIVIGVVVGFVAISIIQPVYTISGGLRK